MALYRLTETWRGERAVVREGLARRQGGEEIQGYLLNVAVGLASIAIAVFGGEALVSLAGYVYLLVFPVQTINGRVMESRRRKNESTRTAAGADGEGP
jgi:hypothetical protein